MLLTGSAERFQSYFQASFQPLDSGYHLQFAFLVAIKPASFSEDMQAYCNKALNRYLEMDGVNAVKRDLHH